MRRRRRAGRFAPDHQHVAGPEAEIPEIDVALRRQQRQPPAGAAAPGLESGERDVALERAARRDSPCRRGGSGGRNRRSRRARSAPPRRRDRRRCAASRRCWRRCRAQTTPARDRDRPSRACRLAKIPPPGKPLRQRSAAADKEAGAATISRIHGYGQPWRSVRNSGRNKGPQRAPGRMLSAIRLGKSARRPRERPGVRFVARGSHQSSRRDFLFLATGAVAAVGAAAVVWPLIDQMNPDASTLALSSIEVDLAPIQEGQIVTVKWRGGPVFLRHRTKKEIDEAGSDAARPISRIRRPTRSACRSRNG